MPIDILYKAQLKMDVRLKILKGKLGLLSSFSIGNKIVDPSAL